MAKIFTLEPEYTKTNRLIRAKILTNKASIDLPTKIFVVLSFVLFLPSFAVISAKKLKKLIPLITSRVDPYLTLPLVYLGRGPKSPSNILKNDKAVSLGAYTIVVLICFLFAVKIDNTFSLKE